MTARKTTSWRRLLEQGWTIQEIAEHEGVKYGTVWRRIQRAGITDWPGKGRTPDRERGRKRAEAARLLRDVQPTATLRQISALLGVTEQRVSQYLQEPDDGR